MSWAIVPNAVPAIAPMNSVGANTPPDPPMPIVRLVANILPTISSSSIADDVLALDSVLQHRVADAVHLRKREQHRAESKPPTAGRAHSGPRHSQSQASSTR